MGLNYFELGIESKAASKIDPFYQLSSVFVLQCHNPVSF